MARNETMQAVKDFIRQPAAWPGGYPKVLIMQDGECLCATCAKSEYKQISDSTRHLSRDGWQAIGVDIHWEGEPIICAHCNAAIESAYGVPEE
jgi:hypothetical protein